MSSGPPPTRPSSRRPAGEGVEILINDIQIDERETDLACAATLWEGDIDLAGGGPDRMMVLDLRPCF